MHYLVYYFGEPNPVNLMEPALWFDMEYLHAINPSIRAFGSESHKIHLVGKSLSHYSLKNSLVIEVEDQGDFTSLYLAGDQIFKEGIGSPELQHRLQYIDWKTVDGLHLELVTFMQTRIHLKQETEITSNLQKIIDRTHNTITSLDHSLMSSEYLEMADKFLQDTDREIARIQSEQRDTKRKILALRSSLQKELLRGAF